MINPNNLRKHVLRMVYEKQSGHIGGSFSIAELIAYLYSNFNLTSNEKNAPKLILSKGHSVPIIYAVLYELGYLSDDDISKFREINSPLQGHPDKIRLKYLHATTGSLGQGLSIAIGHAIGLKLIKSSNPCFCIVGDGEIQEGQIWEGLMVAPKLKSAPEALFPLRSINPATFKSVISLLSILRMDSENVIVISLFAGTS